MLYTFFAFYLIIILKGCFGNELNEKKVLVLNNKNFPTVINDNKFVLVQFYAPQCGACIGLAPEYDKAAQIMSEQNDTIKIAKINAIEETEIAKKYGIDGYPTVRFFRKGLTPLDYKGLRIAENIVSWAIKRTSPPAVLLKNLEEVKNLMANNDVVTIGFFNDHLDDAAETYLSAAELSEDSVFAITFEPSILNFFDVKTGSIILFNKEYDNEFAFNNEFTEREIRKFVEIGSLPLVMEFTAENAMHIFGGHIKTHLLVFLPKSKPDTERLLQDIKTVAKDFKDKMLFTFLDTDNSEYKAFIEYLGVTEKETTSTVRLIHFDRQINKFKPTNPEISVDNIRNFVEKYFDGKLKKLLRSQVLSEDWDKDSVYELVGDNFEGVVMDPTKDVLVEFYAPWCTFCKEFTPVYELIGKHYETYENVIIAKVDASQNEFENKIIEKLPTITLYTKSNEIIDYEGKQTYEAIVAFIESGGTIQETEDTVLVDEDEAIDTKLADEDHFENEEDIIEQEEKDADDYKELKQEL